MAENPIRTPLPADLPEDWNAGQIVAPTGEEVGLSHQHGYNYLMEMVNRAQRASKEIGEAIERGEVGGGVYFGVCNTASGDINKTVETIYPSNFKLQDGVTVYVEFMHKSTNPIDTGPGFINNLSLNVANTGEFKWATGISFVSEFKGFWYDGDLIGFVYFNGFWWMQAASLYRRLDGAGFGGGFVEMAESIPVLERKKDTLYGLILKDFSTGGV